MSIAPFLPGLPVPTAPDGGTTPDGSGGDPGSAFGDALAAALAGTLGAAPAPTPATVPGIPTTATPTPATPVPAIPVPATPPATVTSPSSLADLPVSPADLPVSPTDLPASTVDLPASTVELPVSTGELAVPDQALRRTTDGLSISHPPVPAPADAGEAPVAGVPGSTRATDSSTERTANSIDEIGNSADQTGNSAGITGNSAGITGNSAGITGNSAVAKAVVQQVFPEVTRIVSTVGSPGGPGNGTHRITLTLQPEQLGEVRVTLVVRDGSVHVRLAGGTGGVEGADAAAVHRALASGAPELQRILERTGAEARVTVRDPFAPLLPGTPGTSSAPSGLQAGPDGHARSDTQARQDQAAREQSRGQPREQPRRQEPQRASYPVAATPVAGRLDRTV